MRPDLFNFFIYFFTFFFIYFLSKTNFKNLTLTTTLIYFLFVV